MLLVVTLDEAFDDDAQLPISNTSVEIVDGGEPAAGVDGEVLGLLEVCQWDRFSVVWDADKLEMGGQARLRYTV